MAFVHKRKGYIDHKHETAEQARLCEQGRQTMTTIVSQDSGDLVTYREARHQTPCVCGPYDLCWEFRVAKACRTCNWRDLYRAYND